MRLLRRRLLRFKGWVIIEWAQLVEMGLTGMVNNRVIVVDADQPEVFMAKRGIAPGQVDQILEAQLGFDEKRRWVYEAIKHDRFGSAMTFHNNTNAGVFGRRMNTLLRQIEVL
jgi:dephospho-CoA kinase